MSQYEECIYKIIDDLNSKITDLDKSFPDFFVEEKIKIIKALNELRILRGMIRNWPSDIPMANTEQRIQSDGR